MPRHTLWKTGQRLSWYRKKIPVQTILKYVSCALDWFWLPPAITAGDMEAGGAVINKKEDPLNFRLVTAPLRD